MSSLKELISIATEEFVTAVLAAMRQASLDEILDIPSDESARSAPTGNRKKASVKSKGNKAKRIRRSQDDIQGVVGQIVAFVKRHKDGVSAESIRDELGVERKELPRPIAEALGQKLITKRGHKRATLYFAGASKTVKSAKKSSKKPAKKTAKKSGKKLVAKNHKKMNGTSKKAAKIASVNTTAGAAVAAEKAE